MMTAILDAYIHACDYEVCLLSEDGPSDYYDDNPDNNHKNNHTNTYNH